MKDPNHMMKNYLIYFLIFFGASLILWGDTELLGDITREDILQSCPDWEEVIHSYTPDEEAIESLQTLSYQVEIEVVLGTWCPDSKRHVSEYFKVLDRLDNSNFLSTYIGIPRNKEARESYIKGKNIQKVPTFIVRVEGREIGRIIEIPTKSIEHDLLGILKQ
ncbi:MAG: thioredoxin family protein [Candidatus Aminicenantes bacterium]|jgi:hypothetical protein